MKGRIARITFQKEKKMGYWDETARIIAENGGRGPSCPHCGKEMHPMDDHGRFFCGCGNSSSFFGPSFSIPISKVLKGTALTDEKKKKRGK